MDVNAPNDYDDASDDYADDCELEEEYDENYVLVEEENYEDVPTYFYVFGKPIDRKHGIVNIVKTKVPIIFKKTSNGWSSVSNYPGLTNKYTSNESWEQIEEWLKCDVAGVEIFSSEEEYDDRMKDMINKFPNFSYSSDYYFRSGLNIGEEIEYLKKKICLV
tara:strand:- start:8760 stop:9245 length:486 start_codon:yes stop_codon:yes gene_type:complete